MDLSQIREEIDDVDVEIVRLFLKRMELAGRVAEFKIHNQKEVRDPKRERSKIQALKEKGDTTLNTEGIEELFTLIMSISRKYQFQFMNKHGMGSKLPFEQVDSIRTNGTNPVRAVYQGVEGAYSHEAVDLYFGEEASSFHVDTWEEAMNALSGGRADYAVLPIENSSAGMVGDVYDLLAKYDNYIVGEIQLPVSHALLVLPEAALENIDTIYSHPQAIAQCSKFLNEHSEDMQVLEVYNTAVAAKRVAAEGLMNQAAIASSYAGKLYGLKTLIQPLNHNHANTTRFVVIGNRKIYCKQARKISICFEVAHESGSLYHLLSHIIFNHLNMTRIESRPVPGQNWEYRFFVDFEGNLAEAGVLNALTGISQEAVSFKILGNY